MVRVALPVVSIEVGLSYKCKLDWNSLSHSQNGSSKYCAQCCKTVYDTTQLTTEELLKHWLQTKDGFCGRFVSDGQRHLHLRPSARSVVGLVSALVVWSPSASAQSAGSSTSMLDSGVGPLDQDGDGVEDSVDACPQHPGPPSTAQTMNGCPETLTVESMGAIRIIPRVYFSANRFVLYKPALQVLDVIYQVLASNASIRVELVGHADFSERDKVRLSIRRAESIRDYLVGRGIEASRIVVRGVGETEPIVARNSRRRATNRSVEFRAM